MTSYTLKDAERELQPILDRAPPGAVAGDWDTTTMQAGHSSSSGGYRDADGDVVSRPDGDPHDEIVDVVEKLETGIAERFNTVHIRWTKAALPFMKGKVTVDIRFDARIVPRGTDDPIYAAAAKARRAYWQSRGDVDEGFAAERAEANVYGQTKWFNPHRRVLHIRAGGQDLLATDGLSTPWAGISDEENGVECEVVLAFDAGRLDAEGLRLWADLMVGVGDLVADGYGVARDVETHGAIVFCRTGESYLPLSRIVLSRTDETIAGLPFGAVPLIRATAVTEEEIAGLDPEEDWGATAAREALKRRGIGL